MSRWHSALLDGKRVEDDPLSLYGEFRELVPAKLHDEFDRLWGQFTEELLGCDVSGDEDAMKMFGFVRAP